MYKVDTTPGVEEQLDPWSPSALLRAQLEDTDIGPILHWILRMVQCLTILRISSTLWDCYERLLGPMGQFKAAQWSCLPTLENPRYQQHQLQMLLPVLSRESSMAAMQQPNWRAL